MSTPGETALAISPQATRAAPALRSREPIPLQRQPFYPQLLETTERWRGAPLNEVTADNPRDTLLNFYVVMGQVADEVEAITQLAKQDPGPLWSPAARQRIDLAEKRFALAVKALNTSTVAESIHADIAEEAAMQLKEVLNYTFNNSRDPVTLPDNRDLKELNKALNKRSDSWTWPQTSITLSIPQNPELTDPVFLFSPKTVVKVESMYDEVRDLQASRDGRKAPDLYTNFISTPGHLVPPKWYLLLPAQLRGFLELSIEGQTIFQLISSLLVLIGYFFVILFLAKRLLRTYQYLHHAGATMNSPWDNDRIAWRRMGLVLPVLPLTWISQVVIDDLINFTGLPLTVVKYMFVILYFIAASLLSFYLFEALGLSTAEWLARLRGGGELQLKRVGNLVIPIFRVLGALVALGLIYRLLVSLGLPSTTVLAFSAVPGLAIGLGASKLLGNLFAGLSIQTDRPVRVGEFCRIGNSQGFVTRIGLRSLELQTLESRITIPNAIVDDETIVNYCRRNTNSEAPLRQSLEIRIPIPSSFSPDQIGDLLHFIRLHVQSDSDLQEPNLSIEPNPSTDHCLVFSCLVLADQWDQYLNVRERLLRRFDEIQEQVLLSHRKLRVSFKTPSERLRRIPDLIAEVARKDPLLELKSCLLMHLSDYSYDFAVSLHTHHPNHRDVKDAIDRFNQDLIACLAVISHQVIQRAVLPGAAEG